MPLTHLFIALLQVNNTILYFPKGLKRIYGSLMEWAFMGGFLT